MRVAGGYVVQHNSQDCTAETRLATVADCSSAKAALGPDADDVETETSAYTPKGCSRWQGKWYFNSHVTGKLDGESEPICKAGNAKQNWAQLIVRIHPCCSLHYYRSQTTTRSLLYFRCFIAPFFDLICFANGLIMISRNPRLVHSLHTRCVIITGYVVQDQTRACTRDTILATDRECSRAKAALDPDAADVKSENNAQNPKGCSRWQGKWYFNTHATGKLDGESEPICKAGNTKGNSE